MSLPTITINREDASSSDAQILLDELSATLALLTGDSGQRRFALTDVVSSRSRFIVARDSYGTPLGCGAIRPIDEHIAELKRLYCRCRGGVGAALLAYLEREAIDVGYSSLRLKTSDLNRRAISFYEGHGFERIPPYGPYFAQPGALCYQKSLDPLAAKSTPFG
jgi:GNAT superfamily N-acetyltransferase